ncbi:MAG: SRPBCC family protein [Proteobacteria bacterium]|nr:SRPBCC family protein [Burkholderiales bacterium]
MRARAWVAWLLLALCAVGVQAAAPTAALVARVENEGTGYRVVAEGVVPVDRSIAWAVLTDYDRFHEFLPGITSSRVVRTQGRTRWVSQQGEVRAFFFSLPLDVVMQVDEEPQSILRIELVSGNVEAMNGEWRVSPAGPGASPGAGADSAQVRLSHNGFYAPRVGRVPRVVMRAMLARQVQGVLDGYVAEMVRRSRPGAGAAAPAAARK